MDNKLYENYINILRHELIVAMGCTEPIAIAYAGAKARAVLGKMPERVLVRCSGNIIKNVKGVIVPQSGGKRGIDIAALLGITGGDPEKKLDVLSAVTPEDLKKANEMLDAGCCHCKLAEGVENLYIDLTVYAGNEYAEVEISGFHTNITKIEKNGKIQLKKTITEINSEKKIDKSELTVQDILAFADCVKIEDIQDILETQINCNRAISEEGLKNLWGANVGKVIIGASTENDLKALACARAAAGSDARMAGCSLPVVINSGSGNQGITVTMPIVTFAEAYRIDHEKMLRALCFANLLSLHQKYYIGNLSAYCGAVSAACAAASGIAYMTGQSKDVISNTITNTICTAGGIVCDGAKSSCAAKIATSVYTALVALDMAKTGNAFQAGEGLTASSLEATIRNIGTMGRIGMRETDVEILNLMLEDN